MYEKLLVLTRKIESNRVLEAIKKGFLVCLPLVIAGVCALVVTSLPVDSVQLWYTNSELGKVVYNFFESIYKVTYCFMALYLCLSISFFYGRKVIKNDTSVRIAAMVASFICVLFSLGFHQPGFDSTTFGATGVFTSFIATIISTKIFSVIYDRFYLLHEKKIMSNTSVENRIFVIYIIMVPFALCLLLFYFCNTILYNYFHYYSLNDLLSAMMTELFSNIGTTIWSGMLILLLESLMWFFGIHGGSVMEQVMNNIFIPADLDPNIIVSKTFLDTFGLIGGCGTSICLFIAMIFWEKRKEQRTILKNSIIPLLVNVNEPLIYGVPIFFNPILFVPLLVTPIVSILIAYFATIIGFVPVITKTVAWTTPVFLSGYAATGSINGAIVQLVIIFVGVFIYMPFVKMMSTAEFTNISANAILLENKFKTYMNNEEALKILKRHDSWSIDGEAILSLLKEDINDDNIDMYYQPQMDNNGKIYGAEALLRWKCGDHVMFPPFVIHLAKEAGLENVLGMATVKRVCRDLVIMKKNPKFDLRISVNITGNQINDIDFITDFIAMAREYNIAENLCVEVTEELALEKLDYASFNIQRLNRENIQISMDDFSMGSTSIKSLKKNNFSHVKLDGSLVADMNNTRSKEIISSIISLGDSLGFDVVAEYVDSSEKLEELKDLGCDYFQGYYYSPAIPLKDFIEYIETV